MNRKGDVSDGIVFLITIFFLAVAFIATAFINDKFKDAVQNTVLNQTTVADSVIEGLDNITTRGIQRGFMLIFTFLIIGIMLSSFLVRVHPAWIFLYIFFGVVGILVAALLGNAYNLLISNETLQEVASQQTYMNWVLRNIVKVMVGVLVLSWIILFAKLPGGGGTDV